MFVGYCNVDFGIGVYFFDSFGDDVCIVVVGYVVDGEGGVYGVFFYEMKLMMEV